MLVERVTSRAIELFQQSPSVWMVLSPRSLMDLDMITPNRLPTDLRRVETNTKMKRYYLSHSANLLADFKLLTPPNAPFKGVARLNCGTRGRGSLEVLN
jgi:hypothetical protein